MAQVYTFTDSNGEVRLMAEINPAPGGSQLVRMVSVEITSAQLLAWATPVTVVPGIAGAQLLPIAAAFVYHFGTIQYATGSSAELRYTGPDQDSFGTVFNGALVTNSGSGTEWRSSLATPNGRDDLLNAGEGLELFGGINFTNGDGTLTATVWYLTYPVP